MRAVIAMLVPFLLLCAAMAYLRGPAMTFFAVIGMMVCLKLFADWAGRRFPRAMKWLGVDGW